MATSLAGDAEHDDWIEARAGRGGDSLLGRVPLLLWTLVAIALLSAFLLLVVDDYPLRNLIAVQ
jgi:hypothetical protein